MNQNIYKVLREFNLRTSNRCGVVRIKEKKIARHFMQYIVCLSTPLPYYATHIINFFLESRITVNHDKREGFLANREILILTRIFKCLLID